MVAKAKTEQAHDEKAPVEAIIKAPKPAPVVRSLVHLDDGANTGKYYRPGDLIEGWDDETIARMVASGIAGVEEA